ncbi:MAG TPA: GNAT family N-acetyltransferase [Polyangiaceae bacterium]|nr:GNAT family N-acetyltransferase [Polyangiaceae bacterium]
MSLQWIADKPARWDQDKGRIVGGAPAGVFDARFGKCNAGDVLPGEWWRVERDGTVLGYGWLDVVWGDAEILLATDPESRGQGVGTFILDNLEQEARRKGLNYLYNIVRPTHPSREAVTAWLSKRGFSPSEDGSLIRTVAKRGD